MKKKAFITGVAGQDGSYLTELLLNKNYKVYGIVRRNSVVEHQKNRLDHLSKGLELIYGDLLNESSISQLLKKIKPNEIYNLAAQSHVRISFDIPEFTAKTNAIGVLNLLQAYRHESPNSKFYQASSSEMFGRSVDKDGFQRETTPLEPTSPYGCAKVFAYNLVKHYRNAYKLFACNGILFNHESPRRGSNFVTNKVVKNSVKIYLGLQEKLEVGNIHAYRDWGHAKDYVKAMNKILNYKKADDWVVATGKTRSVDQMINYVFQKLKLNKKKHLKINKKFFRPEELKYLRGDSKKARKLLKWKPEYTFEKMLDEMIEFWFEFYKKNENLKNF
ncbi:MAG: GDP-mannose 4,6-dehydratase [Candidatus Pelagibacter sp.]